ncbi:hypothetical protein C8J56DRAFT_919927 [Mycena floridula]|nr:hypothetical protein C8J56DRAFT_919927 [Mycena floridula]
MMSTETILLQPRPYARAAGKLLLLPLLPLRKPCQLPSELWFEIFKRSSGDQSRALLALMGTCKQFQELARPLLYEAPKFIRISSFAHFHSKLKQGDAQWDSIRRIPFSTPARWVYSLDLSEMAVAGQAEALVLDSLLTGLFPLVPFLTRLSMPSEPFTVLSRRAISSLCNREGITNIRFLARIAYVPWMTNPNEDSLLTLIRSCRNLEELEVIAQGLDPSELDTSNQDQLFSPCEALDLPHLSVLTLISDYASPLLSALLCSPLPSLRKLTMSPYHDVSSSVSQMVTTHGNGLKSLLLLTPKSWPTKLHPSPSNLLQGCPNLRHLSLELPVPALVLTTSHSLEILSIPRPTAHSWAVLERLLPRLPVLCAVRARDVRWLRKGLNSRAQESGVQAEMREWRRRLARRGVRVLDSDWKDIE